MIPQLWHYCEILMFGFHAIVWSRWIFKRILTYPTSKPTNSIERIIQDVYGKDLLSFGPSEYRASYVLRYKNGTRKEVGYNELYELSTQADK